MKGKKYGNYKIIKHLGSGSYGNVFLATKESLEYAIKIIDKDKIVEENLLENIKKEIQHMKVIQHPYIVKLYEVMATHSKIILVLEYVEGGELGDLISKFSFIEGEQTEKRLDEETSRKFFQQIIQALEYCHKAGIIHRDLKPENILIDKKNNCIKISDFGLSTIVKNNDDVLKTACGTINYLAPEVVKQTGYYGACADIWSAGVILFNCVTGKNPFYDENISTLLTNILTANLNYPKQLSKNIMDLMQNIFIVNPKTRYTIQQIQVHPWFNIDYNPVQVTVLEKEPKKTDINYIEDDSSPKKSFLKTPDGLNLPSDEVPIINCFELTSMIAGNFVSNMFNNTTKQIDTENSLYKLICEMDFDNMKKVIEAYFSSSTKDAKFTYTGNGVFILDAYYQTEKLKFFIQFYKITEKKHICTFAVKEGTKGTFNYLLKYLTDKRNDFIIF